MKLFSVVVFLTLVGSNGFAASSASDNQVDISAHEFSLTCKSVTKVPASHFWEKSGQTTSQILDTGFLDHSKNPTIEFSPSGTNGPSRLLKISNVAWQSDSLVVTAADESFGTIEVDVRLNKPVSYVYAGEDGWKTDEPSSFASSLKINGQINSIYPNFRCGFWLFSGL